MNDDLKDNIVNYFRNNKDNQIEKIATHFNVNPTFVHKIINNYFKELSLNKPNRFS